MFDYEAFESKVYTLVTQEVNEAFSSLFKEEGGSMQWESIRLQRKIIETLHNVTEEVAARILCEVLANTKTVHKVPFYSLKDKN